MGQLEWAIYNAVHALGVEKLAEAMRITPQALIDKVNPEHLAHRLSLDQFLLILEATKAESIVAALRERAKLDEEMPENLILVTMSSPGSTTLEQSLTTAEWSQNDAKALEAAANEAVHALGEAVSISWALARCRSAAMSMGMDVRCPEYSNQQ